MLDKEHLDFFLWNLKPKIFLTFGIEAESMRQAKPRLNHIENDLLNNFRRLGVMVAVLTLQNTLIMVEGTAADGSAMLPLTAVSSGAIYAVIVAVTIRMLQKGLARTRQAEKANAPEWASV